MARKPREWFQGRYRSEIIDCDEYFLTINRYIHLNPVKANMVAHPLDYQWSSCREYFVERPNSIVEIQKTLNYFAHPQLEHFREYLENGIILGDEMDARGWHLDRQQLPPSLHLMVTPAHAGIVDKFLTDLAEAVHNLSQGEPQATTGSAALYGMLAQAPDSAITTEFLRGLMDDLTRA